MQPLSMDDLLPLEDFIARRAELFEAQSRYVDRYRRVRIGTKATLIFENRQTLWFRAQDVLRIARITDQTQIERELKVYSRLLPRQNCLQAAFLIKIDNPTKTVEELQPWHALRGEHLQLILGDQSYPSKMLTTRPEDRAMGASHWCQFHIDSTARERLAAPKIKAHFAIDLEGMSQQSTELTMDVRQSLLEDLDLSDRAA